MKEKFAKWLPLLLCAGVLLASVAALGLYARPMADISLDLSLVSREDSAFLDPSAFDSKGWTVYTKEGNAVTELTPDGFGGYSGLELGQTFYFSRVMEEALDSPTIQLDPVEWTFAVWLDDVLIYTDRPELDNRIGYLRLPMNEWFRDDPIIISLPVDYQGKTLTIAQSSPEYAETSRVMAIPTSVVLYCGYAYESGLISEAFRTALICAAVLAVIAILLLGFARSRDWPLLCLALTALSWMLMQLTGTSFSMKYLGASENTPLAILPLVFSLTLMVFFAMRAGRRRRILWWLCSGFALSVAAFGIVLTVLPQVSVGNRWARFLTEVLPFWLAFACLVTVLVLSAVYWRKESWFYRVFTPLAFGGIAIIWMADILVSRGAVWKQITQVFRSGRIAYVFYQFLYGTAAAALLTAIAEAVKLELDRRMEKQLLEQRQEMTMASYENIRRQHEEVMMLRHDMAKHFHTLQAMSSEEQVQNYLTDLLGQNEKIRSVVRTGNDTLDIILNSKLGAAKDAGIRIELQRAQAPASLAIRDADLCSLVMNLMDNAITGAAASGSDPILLLDVHATNDYLVIVCENSQAAEAGRNRNSPAFGHGLGLKIMDEIAERYQGMMDADEHLGRYRVRILIPL